MKIHEYQAKEILKKYQTKYIIWDTQNDPYWPIDQYAFLEETYQAETIKIYKTK